MLSLSLVSDAPFDLIQVSVSDVFDRWVGTHHDLLLPTEALQEFLAPVISIEEFETLFHRLRSLDGVVVLLDNSKMKALGYRQRI